MNVNQRKAVTVVFFTNSDMMVQGNRAPNNDELLNSPEYP